jgi:hypothetical protein
MSDNLDFSPATLDLTVYAGDGTDFQIEFVDENDQAIDVSTLTWTAQIRKTRTSDEASDLEIKMDDASNGIITIHIPADVTRVLPKSSQWDLQSTSETRTEPLTALQGTVTCNPDVTREEVTP